MYERKRTKVLNIAQFVTHLLERRVVREKHQRAVYHKVQVSGPGSGKFYDTIVR